MKKENLGQQYLTLDKIDFNTKAITRDKEPSSSSSEYLSKEIPNTTSKRCASMCSSQHYLQQSRYGGNLGVPQ